MLSVLPAVPSTAYRTLPAFSARPQIEALYVHVPFCTSKCHYCDFYSLADHLHQADDYLSALATEIQLTTALYGRPAPSTIFIGGGTPTLLDPLRLKRLLGLIHQSIDSSRVTEFTIEANPNTFDAARAHVIAEAGINRISFGAQSFIPSELVTLQRDHDPASVPPAVALARSVGITNLNLDLIFGIPGQTAVTWHSSLSQALALAPKHLSCYSLIYEPNTAMTARMKKGEFQPINEDLELDLFNDTYAALRDANFERYEVSNFALRSATRSYRCQHNLHYWTGPNYLSWGPSASTHILGHRWKNVPSLTRYLDALAAPSPVLPINEVEHLPSIQRAGELATLFLRLSDGLDFAHFQSLTGINPHPPLASILKKYDGLDLLQLTATHLSLTEKAVPVSNTILADVLAAFH